MELFAHLLEIGVNDMKNLFGEQIIPLEQVNGLMPISNYDHD